MEHFDIIAGFITAILGLAYPIILQVISSLDEKFSSVYVIRAFRNEFWFKAYKFLLIASIASLILYLLNLSPIFENESINAYLYNTAFYLIAILTLLLIISFFFLFEKIIKYFATTELIEIIKKKHFKNEDKIYTYYRAISDILIFAIKNEQEEVIRTLFSIYDKSYVDAELLKEKGKIEYPELYYQSLYQVLEELIDIQSHKLQYLKSLAINSSWCTFSNSYEQISDKSFNWLWRYIVLAVEKNDDDLIVTIWKKAHSYYTISLRRVDPIYTDNSFEIINQDKIDKREENREDFKAFLYALVGLLLYRSKNNTVKRVLNYTTSDPARYELLPITLAEVYRWFMEFQDPLETKYSWISHQFSFPGLEGLKSDHQIKYWIKKFIAVLFIRQYTVQNLVYGTNPLKNPNSPEKQLDKRLLEENIDYFLKLINGVLEDEVLLKEIGFGYIDENWLKENKKPMPQVIIAKYKESIKDAFEAKEQNQELSKEPVETFEESTNNQINKSIESVKMIFANGIKEKYKSWYLRGLTAIISKSPFTDDQDSSHLNYFSFLGESYAKNIQEMIPHTFYLNRTNSYLLKVKDIFSAIGSRITNKESYHIICFAIKKSFVEKSNISIINDKYKGIDISFLPNAFNPVVKQSIVVIKKEFLPAIVFNDSNKEQKEKYKLTDATNSETKLYASVLDLNKENLLRAELEIQYKDKDLKKYVLLGIFMNMEIRFKKSVKFTMFKLFLSYEEKGLMDNKQDVIIE